MREPHVQHAGFAFERVHAVDEPGHRFARGVIHADHLARCGRHRRSDFSVRGVGDDFEQIEQALVRIGVRVVLVADQHVGRFEHRWRDVTVKIELGADRNVRADARANARQDVAFAVVVAVGDHRAVQEQHHRVERHRRFEIVEQFVAKRFVHDARRRSGRHRKRLQTRRERPAARVETAEQRSVYGLAARDGRDRARGVGASTVSRQLFQPVGSGENVFVSVASIARNTLFIDYVPIANRDAPMAMLMDVPMDLPMDVPMTAA